MDRFRSRGVPENRGGSRAWRLRGEPGERRAPSFLLLACLALAAASWSRGQTGPLFFIQMSDPQFGMYSSNRDLAQETANFEFAVATANRLKPSFVVVTGDLVNKPGDAGQVAEYLRIVKKLDPSIPIHHVAGNHDVGNEPTPESLSAYRAYFGRDYYGFRSGPVYGIVLNSAIVQAPQNVPGEAATQEAWLARELENARASGSAHILLFQHHPFFTREAGEKDAYENIPLGRRQRYLGLLERFGVRRVFAGHYHQNAVAWDGELEMITTGPIGNPLGRGKSGMRFVQVDGPVLRHEWRDFGDLPATLQNAFK